MTHRIILLNFTEKEAQHVSKAGFNVDRGFIGRIQEPNHYCPFSAPHPLYEYDILFYNSYLPAGIEKDFPQPVNLFGETGSFSALCSFGAPPAVRVSFIGEESGAKTLIHGGVGFAGLVKADANVSSFYEHQPHTFAIEELHKLLTGFATQVATVGQFFETPTDNYPFYNVRVLGSRGGGQIAGYGTTYNTNNIPRYIVLPLLKDMSRAVVRILQCLENVVPTLFPDKANRNWLHSEEFLLPEERRLNEAMNDKIAEATAYIETKKKEKDSLAQQVAFVRALLIATEDPKLDLAVRLSGVVKRALEFLEFEVTDIDQKIKSAIKKEDFWVADGNFLAITEVTGTRNKNPKVKEYNDILGRLTTIYKRKGELVIPKGASVSGLLVLNYDIDTHPAKRPRVYTGEDEHIIEAAIEQGIGLLSTVELHKIIVAVKEGIISIGEAREILKKPGRIAFGATGRKESATSA